MTPIFLAVGADTVLAVGAWCWAESSLLLPSVALGLLTILRSSLASTRSSPVFGGAPTRVLKRHLARTVYKALSPRCCGGITFFEIENTALSWRRLLFGLFVTPQARKYTLGYATQQRVSMLPGSHRTMPTPRDITTSVRTNCACVQSPPARPPAARGKERHGGRAAPPGSP